jgi:hypothetical protein
MSSTKLQGSYNSPIAQIYRTQECEKDIFEMIKKKKKKKKTMKMLASQMGKWSDSQA